MRIFEHTKVRVFTIYDAPALDPITVVLQDFDHGCGRVILECWGRAWSAYWGAMGELTIREFFLECHHDYLLSKLVNGRRTKSDEKYLTQIIEATQSALRHDTTPKPSDSAPNPGT